MDNNSFYKGFFFAFIFIGILGSLTAIGFHTADEIFGGTFNGNFSFAGNVNFTDAEIAGFAGVESGGIMYFVDGCPTGWTEANIGGFAGEEISRLNGTPIGNLINGGGLAAGFDGVLNQDWASAAGTSGTWPGNGYLGKDWGEGNEKIVGRYHVYSSTYGMDGASQAATVTLRLEGSNDNVNWDNLHTTSFADQWAYFTQDIISGIDTSTAYRYHRIHLTATFPDGGQDFHISEVKFYEAVVSCKKD